ncbi:MAG: PKD domain-containing protein, partial [Bacteroidetes bacterium]|nr:PKD domain-containing protein [Bacteroidota bacterium]
MNRILTLVSFTLALMVGTAEQIYSQITGDTSVCTGETVIYHIPAIGGASYAWSATGGSIIGPGNQDSVMLTWGMPGTGILLVTVISPNNPPAYYFINVTIHPKPSPVITHVPYPTCPSAPGQDGSVGGPDHGSQDACEKVCKYARVTYSTPFNTGSSYQWVATGDLQITGATTNAATVTWDSTFLGTLTVYETNQWGCKDSTKICVEKVDLPVAQFTHPASACKNSPVPFTNQSTGAISYQWYFGDGSGSILTNPTHTYANGGTYTITLIAVNKCYCSDTVTSTIFIDNQPGPDITCPSTICAFDTAVYSTSQPGCTYNWFALGGTILGPSNQQSVTVAWGAGQLGHLGLYVSGCTGLCTDTTWITIPIVPAVAVISGPSKVCPGDCEEYSIPNFSGATFSWSLHGSSCGTISDTSCCGKVQICWPSYLFTCIDTLTVTYYDAFLGCGGTATKIIRLRPKLSIYGLNTACANSSSNYFASGGIPSNWSISPSGPVLSPSPSPNLNVSWMGLTGTFVITAKPVNPNAACNDSATIIVTVSAPPQAPKITGDTLICPNTTSQYCATGSGNFHWILTGGTPANGTGNCVTVNWGNTPPFLVQVFTQMASSPYCSSDTTTQNITAFLSLPLPSITGLGNACANGTSNYSCSTVYPAGAVFTWSVNLPNAGTILSGQGTNSIQVEWGNNAPQPVTVSLTVTLCGLTATNSLSVNLNPPPNPTIVQNGNLCPGGIALLNATGGAFSAYQWTGPGGFTSTSNPISITQSGLYQLTVTDAGGCTALTQLTVSYVGAPVASITTMNPLVYCTGTPFTVNLCALGNANYTYNWSNGVFGPAAQCIAVNTAGSYTVTVTDANGCFSISNTLNVIVQPCIPDTGQPCFPTGTVGFTPSSCNPKVFTNTSANFTSSFWDFGDFTSSNLTNPTHTYTQAGFFLVTLTVTVPNAAGTGSCLLTDTQLIEIPLLADFSHTTGCYG